MREYQVRICERLGVKFPGPTRHSRPKWALRTMSAFLPLATRQRTSPVVRFVPTTEVAQLMRPKQKAAEAGSSIQTGWDQGEGGRTIV